MIDSIEKYYNTFVENNFISYDQKQVDLLKNIYEVWTQSKRINFFSTIKKLQGIYVYGSVGIGKTFVFNLFLNFINSGKKYNISFNRCSKS